MYDCLQAVNVDKCHALQKNTIRYLASTLVCLLPSFSALLSCLATALMMMLMGDVEGLKMVA